MLLLAHAELNIYRAAVLGLGAYHCAYTRFWAYQGSRLGSFWPVIETFLDHLHLLVACAVGLCLVKLRLIVQTAAVRDGAALLIHLSSLRS